LYFFFHSQWSLFEMWLLLIGEKHRISSFSSTVLFFLNFIIHMCIQGLGHFFPLPPPPPLPPTLPPPCHPHPLNTQQKLFCPYF
jgi:hypothetical protein